MCFFPIYYAIVSGEQEEECFIHVRIASLVMAIGDPQDGFSYHNHTRIMDSYFFSHINAYKIERSLC